MLRWTHFICHMASWFQSDLMVFSSFILNMCSKYLASPAFLLNLCWPHAKTNMLRNQYSLIHSQMTPLNWFFYWIVYVTLTSAHLSDIPPISFFSIIPFVREVNARSRCEANETLLVCEQALFTLIIVTLIIQSDEILRLLSGQRFRPEHLFWVFDLKRNR